MLYLPSALSKITTRFFFLNDCCLLLSRTLPVSLSLSNVLWLVGVVFGPIWDIWNSCIFWVQQPSELSVEERNMLSSANKFPSCWCCITVHVPRSFRWYGLQPVCTARKSSTDLEKSRDFVQTSGFTFGDNVTHFVTAFSVVACCVLLSTCSFLSHPSVCMAQAGYFDFVTCAH